MTTKEDIVNDVARKIGMPQRMECNCCDWRGGFADLLRAKNPFDESSEIYGCPDCKEIQDFKYLCDLDGCNREATCGIAMPTGYARCCGNHFSQLDAQLRASETGGETK